MALTMRCAAVAAIVSACVTATPAAVVVDAKISGKIIDAQTGAALAGAQVRLHKVGILGRGEPGIRSDADGSFVFDHVSTGLWTVSSNLVGYSAGLSGIAAYGDQPVTTEITDTDTSRDVVVRMFKTATVSGRVVNARGLPVADAAIWLVSKQWVGGRQVQRATRGNGVRTDSRGEYQVTIFSPGEYVFAVTPNPSPQLATVMPIYYGNSARLAGAKSLVVGAGEDLTRIDFAFPDESTTSIDGQLVGSETRQLFSVHLTPIEAGGPGLIPVAVTAADTGGRFTFRGVRAGDYQLRVLRLPGSPDAPHDRPPLGFARFGESSLEYLDPPTPEGPTWYSEQVVSVGRDGAHDVKLNLTQGRPLSGRVSFQGTTEQPRAERLPGIVIMVHHESLWTSTPFRARVEADGSFRTVGLPPGRYGISVEGIPAGWRLGGISDPSGADLTVRPVVVGTSDAGSLAVTLIDRETKLAGTIVDRAGVATVGEVVVFPADPQQWADFSVASRRFWRIATTDRGNYSMAGLVPADYFIIAVGQGQRTQFEPATLSRLAALATKVSLTPGETVTNRLTTQQVR